MDSTEFATLDGSIKDALEHGMFVHFRPNLEANAYLVHVGRWRKKNVTEARDAVDRGQVDGSPIDLLAATVDRLVEEVSAKL